MVDNALPHDLVYVGFWLRLLASLVDTGLLLCVILPLGYVVYGSGSILPDSLREPGQAGLADPLGWLVKGPADVFISWVLPAVAVIVFWIARSATPGKMMIGAKIVDARTFGHPTTKQLIGRYFGYYLSMLPLVPPLGMVWIAFDRRKQGWHDKLAGTVVVRARRTMPEKAVPRNAVVHERRA